MASPSPVCPPLPASSIDFDALQEAARKGLDLAAHIAEQVAGVAAIEPTPPALVAK